MTPPSTRQDEMAVNISLIRPEQIEAAVELFCVQLREHKIKAEASRVRAVLEKIVTDERYGFVLVATEAGKLVGVALGCAYLGVEHGGVSGWLEELYVRPEWRQKGIGTRLVSEVVRLARARGWRALDLEVEADHQRVMSLYLRHGFRPHTRSRFFLKLG